MRTSFNRYFSGKRKHSFEYIGLTLEEFKIYIESLFLPNMTWDNYGKYGWHIDHITPLSSFNFSNYTGEELEKLIHKAYHYTNLQPLWAKDNLSKGGKINDE